MKLAPLILLVPALWLPAIAQADTEQAISVGLGWATFSARGKAMNNQEPPSVTPTIGGIVSVTYERALSSEVVARGELVGGLFYGGTTADDQTKVSNIVLGDVGVAYRFDVLKYVPYAFGGIGMVTAGGGPLDRDLDFALVLGGGVDWLRSRERSYGLELRLASFGGDITVFTAGVRGTVRWGFF
ncbi:MAG: hypothetical protein ACTHU0_37720 [Kofleriaceae bacterium]